MQRSMVEVIRNSLLFLTLALHALSQVHAQDNGKPLATRHLTFSLDGRWLAATYGEVKQPGLLRVWDWQSGQMVLEHHEPVGVCSVSFSPNGNSVAIGMFDKVGKVFDVATGKLQLELRGHESHVRSIAYVDAHLIATGSYDKTIRLWNADTGQQIRELGQHSDELRNVVVSPDGRYLLSGSTSPDCRLWDLVNLKQVALFDSPNFICPNVGFSRDGKYFLTARWDATVRIRELDSHRLRAVVRVRAIRSVDLSPDNSLLLACDDKMVLSAVNLRLSGATAEESARVLEIVKLWNSDDYQVREQASRDLLEMGMVVVPLLDRIKQINNPEIRIRARTAQLALKESSTREVDVGHEFNVSVVCFSPDNLHVASGDAGGVVQVWRFRDETVVQKFEPIISPDDEETSRQ